MRICFPFARIALQLSLHALWNWGQSFAGPNPPYGALITYYLKSKPDDKTTFKIQILDENGKLVQELEKPAKEKGLNRVTWNLRYGGAEVRRPPTEEESAFGGPPVARRCCRAITQ
jgi:hypothetical protein